MKREKPSLVVDCDEVLLPLVDGMLGFAAANDIPIQPGFAPGLAPTELGSYDFGYLFAEHHDRVFWEYVESIPEAVVPGAFEAIKALSERYRIDVVTAREQSMREDTARYLVEHFGEGETTGLTCVGWGGKDWVLRQLGSSAFIDDSRWNIQDAVRVGVETSILFGDYAWNSDEVPHGATRCVDWAGVCAMLL
jgi:hypothetical protein